MNKDLKENKEKQNDFVMTSEDDFVKKLGNIKSDDAEANFDILLSDVKDKLDTFSNNIDTFLKENVDFKNYDEETKNKLYDEVFAIHDALKLETKHAKCKFPCTGLEIKTLINKLHKSVEYNAETLFYGLHLKSNFLNNLPKADSEFKTYDINITMSQSIAMYHVLSTLVVKGLNKENYALANILYNLAEISKIYQYYDNLSVRLNRSIMQWNMGLSNKEASVLESSVIEQMIIEEKEKAEK